MKLKAATVMTLTLLVVSITFNVVPVFGSTPCIEIGIVGPKGVIQWNGLWQGAQMAMDEINDAGGINIDGVSYNIQLVDIDEHAVPVPNPAEAVTELLTKLDAHPDMQFLIGGFRTECVFAMREAAMDYAADYGRPIWFIAGAADDELIEDVRYEYDRYKYMFRLTPSNATTLLNALVAFMRDYLLPQELVPKYGSPVKTCIVAEDLAWCDGIRSALTWGGAEGPALGPQCQIVGSYRPSSLEMDFTSIFEQIENAEARLVVHIFSSLAGGAFIKQWVAERRPFTCVGINVESQLQEFYEVNKGLCEYEVLLVPMGTRTPIVPGVTDKFWDDYEARWGHSPIYTAIGAYDATMALAETLRNPALVPAWPMTCDQLIPIIEQTDRTGLLGKFKYTEYHDDFCNELGSTWTQGYARPLIVQWQSGRMEVIWPQDQLYSRTYKVPKWMGVGGIAAPINKPELQTQPNLQTPNIGLVLIIILPLVATVVFIKHKKKKQ